MSTSLVSAILSYATLPIYFSGVLILVYIIARPQGGGPLSEQDQSSEQQVKAEPDDPLMKKMVHYVTCALIFFSIALFFLTVGVFITPPNGVLGIFFLCISLPFVVMSINYFVRYALISKKIKKTKQGRL